MTCATRAKPVYSEQTSFSSLSSEKFTDFAVFVKQFSTNHYYYCYYCNLYYIARKIKIYNIRLIIYCLPFDSKN